MSVRKLGHCGRGGTKLSSTGTLCKARRPAGKKPVFSRKESGKVHVETWAGCNESLSLKISQVKQTQTRCAVSVFPPRPSFFTPALPGPGSEIRRMMGWTQVGKTERSGLWRFRGALRRRESFPVLCAAVDWVRKGPYHTAWSVPSTSSCSCSYAYKHGTAVGPQTGERGVGYCLSNCGGQSQP